MMIYWLIAYLKSFFEREEDSDEEMEEGFSWDEECE
jgi:hypothetical protein